MHKADNDSTAFLAYTTATGLQAIPSCDVPRFLRDAVQHHSPHDVDRALAEAGCMCVEHYGLSVETLDVWRLPNGSGWYINHDDGDAVDLHIIVRKAPSYARLQATFIAPVAMKIIAGDNHWMLRHRMNVEELAA